MSKISDLIAKLCPNGVEYKKLGEVAEICRGVRVVRKELSETGKYEVFQNSLKPLGRYDSFNVKGKTAFVIGAGAAGEIGYSENDFWAADDCYYVDGGEKLMGRYAYYCLTSRQDWLASKVRKASIPRLARDFVKALVIPVPPLEVQREVVEVLDKFALLTAELTAELEKRKKQYEHYRDKLFSAKVASWPEERVGDIAETSIGLATSVTPYKADSGVLLIHNSDIQQNAIVMKQYEYLKESFVERNSKKTFLKDDIITVHTGDVGTSAVITEEYVGCIGFTTIRTRISRKDRIVPKYLCHYLNSHRCKSDIATMTISDRSNLNQKSFDQICIPIPPLAEQERIVKILDKFDKLCNDLTSGLPAEIAARKKQYEYYRDKLLTFKRKEAA